MNVHRIYGYSYFHRELTIMFDYGGMFARRAPGALLLDYVPPEEPPSTPLGNALRIR